jgi:hypothetical protein
MYVKRAVAPGHGKWAKALCTLVPHVVRFALPAPPIVLASSGVRS